MIFLIITNEWLRRFWAYQQYLVINLKIATGFISLKDS